MTKPFKLTSKSQVTVPRDVRDALGVGPGEFVAFDHDGDRIVVRKAEPPAVDEETAMAEFRVRLERARAMAKPLPLGMTTDEYMAMIREPLPPYDQ